MLTNRDTGRYPVDCEIDENSNSLAASSGIPSMTKSAKDNDNIDYFDKKDMKDGKFAHCK